MFATDQRPLMGAEQAWHPLQLDRRAATVEETEASMRHLVAALITVTLCIQPGHAEKIRTPPPAQQEGTVQQPQGKPTQGSRPGSALSSCTAPLRQGCEAQQSSCRLACPPTWSTNPSAPAFTPTDRAGCTRQCLTRHLSCLRLYGCS
jgi:hypothetical protein